MANAKCFLFFAVIFVSIASAVCWIPRIVNGRPKGGKLRAPKAPAGVKLPPAQWFQTQRLDHFDGSNYKVWKQVRRLWFSLLFSVISDHIGIFLPSHECKHKGRVLSCVGGRGWPRYPLVGKLDWSHSDGRKVARSNFLLPLSLYFYILYTHLIIILLLRIFFFLFIF